ncbi:flagellar hook-length control protein FliK [Blastomonas sp.]|uniref:flagellar hook-length control protein FliK n=1 Tax=Blastomonas sp. TaxID=1909299 RepID=UPI00391BF05C
MSHDIMQALSGSSMLSLSVGTLPAVKPGMSLDANPFASQLALMTTPDAALGGAGQAASGGAVEGEASAAFAAALVQAGAPLAGSMAEPVAQSPAVTASALPDTVAAAEVAPLPEDASPSQIIEAVLAGTMKPAPGIVQTQVPAAKAGAAQTSDTTRARSIAPGSMPEAVAADEIAAEPHDGPHSVRPRRAAHRDTSVATAADAAPVAAPVVEPALPAPVRPQASAPETGSVRVAISANPSMAAHPAPAADEALGADAAPTIVPDAAQSFAQSSAQMTPVPAPPAQPDHAQRPATASAPRDAAVAVDPDTATPAQPAAAVAQAPVAVARPDVDAAAAPAVAADPATVARAATDPALAAAVVQPGQGAAQPPRSVVSATSQRTILAASQGARPAEALGAVLGLGDPAAPLPASSPAARFADAIRVDATRLDAMSAAPAETVPPAWAAALNAVASPVTTQAAFGLTAAAAAGNAAAAPLATLSFDEGFVGNVETQIARVIGEGQLVRMQIMPEHLGRIDIELLAGPKRDHVRIVTEHDAVRDTLAQSQIRLEQELRNNGNRNTDITVELRQPSTGTQGGSAQQQRGQSGSEPGPARDGMPRQAAADSLTQPNTAQRRPRDNVRYA